MPELAMVSITLDWESKKTTIGGIIRMTAAAAAAPARATPEAATCLRMVGNSLSSSLKINYNPSRFHSD